MYEMIASAMVWAVPVDVVVDVSGGWLCYKWQNTFY